MATLFKPMDVQVDGDGITLSGAKLYFYTTGTTTPQNTYSQADLDISHVNANPVLADADGLWPPIYLGTTDYKVILKTSAGATIQTLDPVLVNPQAGSLSDEIDDEFGSTQYSLLQRGASAWQAVTFKAVLDNKFGTSNGTLIKRGFSDWEAWSPSPVANSLGADVNLADMTLFYTGPTVAQGTTGTWFASGKVTVGGASLAAGDEFVVKLWDGTTVIDSTIVSYEGPNGTKSKAISLSGYLASPAGNIRVSVKCTTNTAVKILFNASGASKDSTLTAFRIS